MGTTAEKLTYLNTTKQKIKDAINNIGGNITSETTFRQYVAALESIYQSMPKVSGSGTTLSLTPTLKGLMQIDLKGNTSQEGTPTPDNPQDIHNVSGNNSIVVCGKNLFDKSAMVMNSAIDAGNGNMTSSDNFRTAYIKCKPNTTYSISKILSNRFVVGFTSDEDLTLPKTLTNVWSNQAITTKTITSPNNAYYMFITLSKITDDTTPIQDILDSLQVEINETPTTYEAYNGTTYPINLPSGMELSKIGTYQDYFYKENDKWYLHKEIGKVVLNGSEEWIASGKAIFTRITNAHCLSNTNADVGDGSIDYVICDNFAINGLGDIYTYGTTGITLFYMVNNPSEIRLAFGIGDISVNDFKTWLTTHNTIVYYEYEIPTNTEITDTTLLSQLEAIYNAKSKNGTTNINQENNDLGFILDVSCLKGA